MDLAFTKRFPIHAARIDFRGEIFNLFNWVNFGNPAANISNTNVGIITSADDPARGDSLAQSQLVNPLASRGRPVEVAPRNSSYLYLLYYLAHTGHMIRLWTPSCSRRAASPSRSPACAR